MKSTIFTKDDQEFVAFEDYEFGLGLQMPDAKVMAPSAIVPSLPSLTLQEIREIVSSDEFKFGREWFDSSWVTNQNGHGSCFPTGTLVRMADGTQKPIENITVLDEVVTAEGNTGRVMCTQVRDHEGDIVTLKLWGHRHLKATEEHPILTKDGYKAIGDLTKDDWVAIPKYSHQECDVIVPEEYCEKPWRMKSQKATNSPRGIPGKTQVFIKRSPVPAAIKLDYSFGRIVGLFLAEGSTTHGKVVFSLHKDECETLGLELEQRFSELGVTVSRVVRQNKTIVRVYGGNWVDLFQNLCATGSAMKFVHRDLVRGPKEFLQGVLEGWEAGDGLGPGIRGGCTVSHTLALNMFDIANSLGYMPVVRTRQPKLSHGVKSRKRRYDVTWNDKASEDAQSRAWRCKQDDDVLWRRVAGLERTDFNGPVFNLEVEGDHSYVAECIGVHNCASYGGASALAKSRVLGGQPRIDLSGDYLYSLVNGGKDRGSMLDDNMEAMMKNGVCKRSTVPLGKIYRGRYDTDKADREAKRFRGHELHAVRNEQELATQLLFCNPVVIAIHVTGRWREFDSQDVLAPANGMGNHCEHLDDIRYNKKRGRLEFRKATSHGSNYSDDGYCWTYWDGHYKQTSKYHMFYAVPAAILDPEEEQEDFEEGEREQQDTDKPLLEVITSDNCGACITWKRKELKKVEASGYQVNFVDPALIPGRFVPRFRLTVNNKTKDHVGYWSLNDIKQEHENLE